MVTTKTPKSLIFQSVATPCMERTNRINSVCVTAREYKCENRLGLAEKKTKKNNLACFVSSGVLVYVRVAFISPCPSSHWD